MSNLVSKNRYHISNQYIQDQPAEKKQKAGIRKHKHFTWLLSLICKAFKSENGTYLNTNSARQYIKRHKDILTTIHPDKDKFNFQHLTNSKIKNCLKLLKEYKPNTIARVPQFPATASASLDSISTAFPEEDGTTTPNDTLPPPVQRSRQSSSPLTIQQPATPQTPQTETTKPSMSPPNTPALSTSTVPAAGFSTPSTAGPVAKLLRPLVQPGSPFLAKTPKKNMAMLQQFNSDYSEQLSPKAPTPVKPSTQKEKPYSRPIPKNIDEVVEAINGAIPLLTCAYGYSVPIIKACMVKPYILTLIPEEHHTSPLLDKELDTLSGSIFHKLESTSNKDKYYEKLIELNNKNQKIERKLSKSKDENEIDQEKLDETEIDQKKLKKIKKNKKQIDLYRWKIKHIEKQSSPSVENLIETSIEKIKNVLNIKNEPLQNTAETSSQ